MRERWEAFKARHGRAYALILLALCVSFILDRWQDIDFAVNHRSVILNTLARIGNVLLSDWFLIPAFVVVTAVALYISTRPLPSAEGIRIGTPIVKVEDFATPPVPEHQPHEANKDYSPPKPIHNVMGQGRFRTLAVGLDEVPNGYDRGVRGEVRSPSGRSVSLGYAGLHDPRQRRRVADEGLAVSAVEEGDYAVVWRNEVPAPYEPEIIAEETVPLPTTGPLEGWDAEHTAFDDEVRLIVNRDEPSRGLLHGFECVVAGPSGEFAADDRGRESQVGIITPGELPRPKGQGEFRFPQDFREAPEVRNLQDGEYTVYWTAWQDEGDDFGAWRQLDVARDQFTVMRSGLIV